MLRWHNGKIEQLDAIRGGYDTLHGCQKKGLESNILVCIWMLWGIQNEALQFTPHICWQLWDDSDFTQRYQLNNFAVSSFNKTKVFMTWLVPKAHKQQPETAIRKLISVRETNVIFGCKKDLLKIQKDQRNTLKREWKSCKCKYIIMSAKNDTVIVQWSGYRYSNVWSAVFGSMWISNMSSFIVRCVY